MKRLIAMTGLMLVIDGFNNLPDPTVFTPFEIIIGANLVLASALTYLIKKFI